MRFLFAITSEDSHFYSMPPLAWSLMSSGHEVQVASQPELEKSVTKAGLTCVPIGRDHKMWSFIERGVGDSRKKTETHSKIFEYADCPEEEATWDVLRSGFESIVPWGFRFVNDPMIRPLVDYCRYWKPDMVVWEPSTFAGAIAAEACGAAHARITWGLDFHGRLRDRYLRLKAARPEGQRDDPLQEWLTRQAQRFGVPYSERLVRGHFTIEQLPEAMSWNTGPDYLRMRYVPYNGQAVVPDWLWTEPERPRIALSLGRSTLDRPFSHAVGFQDLLDALSGLECEIVATVPAGQQEELGKVPDNVRVVDFVPLLALLPTCSAVIHHGGFGSMGTALVNGVPQLILPEHFDAPAKARKLTELGVALSIPAARATTENVRLAVSRLLNDPGFTDSAKALAEQSRALPSPADVVDELERRLVAHGAVHATGPSAPAPH